LRDELMVEPLTLREGRVVAPQAPGLGVHLPDGIEEKYPYRRGTVYRILGS